MFWSQFSCKKIFCFACSFSYEYLKSTQRKNSSLSHSFLLCVCGWNSCQTHLLLEQLPFLSPPKPHLPYSSTAVRSYQLQLPAVNRKWMNISQVIITQSRWTRANAFMMENVLLRVSTKRLVVGSQVEIIWWDVTVILHAPKKQKKKERYCVSS